MLGKRIINSNDAGGACTTNTNDYPITNLAYYKMSSAADEKDTYNGTATDVNFNVQGKFGNAGEFNGSSSINLGSASPNFSNNKLSFSFWHNPTSSVSNYKMLFSTYTSSFSDGFFNVSRNIDNTLEIGVYAGAGWFYRKTTSAIFTNNTWKHIVLVMDNTQSALADKIVVYVDNVVIATSDNTNSGTPSGNFLNTSNDLLIGNWQYATGYGDLAAYDQVRIFSSALNANQVESLYNEVYCVPTIVPTDYFEPVIYTGNGGTKQITTLDFQPDFTWIKSRNSVGSHIATDSVRGNGKEIYTDLTNAQGTVNRISLTSTGFDVVSSGYPNQTNNTFVAWNWKAGGAAVSNTDGTITTQVSANVDAGFSIVQYTAAGNQSFGHGLSQAPELIIQKLYSTTSGWYVYSAPTGLQTYLQLNSTAALGGPDSSWITAVTNATFTANWSGNSYSYINYCFHSVDGYSKIGSYKGNAGGNTIVTGFRPAFVMIKKSTGTADWFMHDNKRLSGTGYSDKYLRANSNADEVDSSDNDLLKFDSSGFTLNTTYSSYNASGETYIFMAFAEEALPYVTRNATNPFGDSSELSLYKFEDNIIDAEGNQNATAFGSVTYASGYIDKAAVFNGSNAYINTNVNFTDFSNGDYTVSMWVNKNTDANAFFAGTINNNGALNGIYFAWILSTHASTPNAIRFIERNATTTATSIISTASYTFGQWIHVVGVRSGGTNFLYVNGTPQGSASNQNITHSTDFTIGRAGAYTTGYLNGSIDQVRIFNRALDSGEVTALYNE